ncbi:MFS transporter [Hyphobacterium marinum]|uniref:MFS transporter n=1 Tax=Hyphobacterium marinum TaxID=3116574 RepID=A0ABU7LWQ5_9PROT|nr:MFS transporter [Hyphobacterium sp. Y6023]MEE2565425.1 MFS transporter [Hyphobacterium sp. Y6023]
MADATVDRDTRTWLETAKVYFTPVMLSMLVLGFASGLPLYMVFQKLSYWLRDVGIDRSTIGFFYWVTLAYSFKFLWAPVVDRFKIPVLHAMLGARRSWIVTAITGTVIALCLIAVTDPTGAHYRTSADGTRLAEISAGEYALLMDSLDHAITEEEVDAEEATALRQAPERGVSEDGTETAAIPVEDHRRLLQLIETDEHFSQLKEFRTFWILLPIAIAALLLAYSGATLDVAIDAWRIESAPNRMQANMAAAYSLGYRFAYLMSGLGLAISAWANWNWSFLVMAAAMAVSAFLVFFMKEPAAGAGKRELKGNFPQKVASAVWEPLYQFFALLRWWIVPVILFVMIYRMSDFTMGVMASPLYSDLGFDRAIVGGIQGGPGLIATMTGLFIGGVAVYRFGLMKAMVIGLVITFITNGAYAWLAGTAGSDEYWKLTVAIVGDNLAGGFVTTAFIAYMSSLVDPANAATQYALLASFYALVSKFLSGFSGVLADAVGWVNFFIITAGYTLPAAVLLFYLMMAGPKAAKGLHKFAERELAKPAGTTADDPPPERA